MNYLLVGCTIRKIGGNVEILLFVQHLHGIRYNGHLHGILYKGHLHGIRYNGHCKRMKRSERTVQ